ncbi:MAG: coat protein [Cressdnaviricota sp.]|nr:MAG: coat protein [Cressdnaviricota sp.]
MPARKSVSIRVPKKKKTMVTVTRARVAKPKARASYKTKSGSKRGLFGTAGGTVGGMIGTALGGPAGGMLGSTLGRLGGAALSSIFGHGDYEATNAGQIKNNNIVLSNSAQAPQFGSGKVACKFVHREYLGDVFSSSTANSFKIDSYPINPGQGKTFPWLSGVVGAKFQQYRINGMAFEFRSMSSDALNSTNTALGSVIMSTDYDSADSTFASKQEMENTEYGVSCKPSSNMMHGIECERFQTPVSELYIRAFDVPSGKDIRLYDLGRFSIASTGCQGTNVNLGELWVAYDIDCFKAIEQVPGYLIPFSQYGLFTASATAPLGVTRSQLLTTGADNSIDLTLTENKISWPIDIEIGSVYHVQLCALSNEAQAVTLPAITAGNGMYINANTIWKTPGTAGVAIHDWQISLDVKYVGGGTPAALPFVNFADYTWAVGAIVQSDLYVTQLSGLYPGAYTSQAEVPDPLDEPDYVDMDEKKSCARMQRLRIRT